MKTTQDILKFSGLLFLLPGTFLVLFSEAANSFFSETSAIPIMVILITGIVMNLTGFMILHAAKQTKFSPLGQKFFIALHSIWLMTALIALLMNSWITTVNGITIIGLWLIFVSWLAWQLLHHK